MASLPNPVRNQFDYVNWVRSVKKLGKVNRLRFKRYAKVEQTFDREDPLVGILQEYKHKNKMRTLGTYQDLVDVVGQKPVIATLKVDGMLCAAGYENGQVRLASLEGRILCNLPVTDEIEHTLRGKGDTIIIGELYGVNNQGKELPFNKTLSLIRNPNTELDEQRIRMAAFDLLEYEGHPLEHATYWQVSTILNNNFEDGTYINPVYIKEGQVSTVKKLWDQQVFKEGREGLVVHADHTYKIKPVNTADLAVLGIEKSNKRLNWAGALLLAFLDDDRVFRDAGKVGTGLTLKDREDWYKWAELNGISQTDRDILVDPYKGDRVVEVKYKGSNISSRPAWVFEGAYKSVGKLPSTALRQPTLVRIRADKHVAPDDIYPEQVPAMLKGAIYVVAKEKTLTPYKTERGGNLDEYGVGIANFITARLALEEAELSIGLLRDILSEYNIPSEYAKASKEHMGLGFDNQQGSQFASLVPYMVDAMISAARYEKEDVTDSDKLFMQKMKAILPNEKPLPENLDDEALLIEWQTSLKRWEPYYNVMVDYIFKNYQEEVFEAPIDNETVVSKISDIVESKVAEGSLPPERGYTIMGGAIKHIAESEVTTMFGLYGFLGVELNPSSVVEFIVDHSKDKPNVAYSALSRLDSLGYSLPRKDQDIRLDEPRDAFGVTINSVPDFMNVLVDQFKGEKGKETRQNLQRAYQRMDYREEDEDILEHENLVIPIVMSLVDKDQNSYEVELAYDKPPEVYVSDVETEIRLYLKGGDKAEAEAVVVYIGKDSPLLAEEEELRDIVYDQNLGPTHRPGTPANVMFLVTPNLVPTDYEVSGIPLETLDRLRANYSKDIAHPEYIGDAQEILDLLSTEYTAEFPESALSMPGVWSDIKGLSDQEYRELVKRNKERGVTNVIDQANKERDEVTDMLPINGEQHAVYYAEDGALALSDRVFGTVGILAFNNTNTAFMSTPELSTGYRVFTNLSDELLAEVEEKGYPSLSEMEAKSKSQSEVVTEEGVLPEEEVLPKEVPSENISVEEVGPEISERQVTPWDILYPIGGEVPATYSEEAIEPEDISAYEVLPKRITRKTESSIKTDSLDIFPETVEEFLLLAAKPKKPVHIPINIEEEPEISEEEFFEQYKPEPEPIAEEPIAGEPIAEEPIAGPMEEGKNIPGDYTKMQELANEELLKLDEFFDNLFKTVYKIPKQQIPVEGDPSRVIEKRVMHLKLLPWNMESEDEIREMLESKLIANGADPNDFEIDFTAKSADEMLGFNAAVPTIIIPEYTPRDYGKYVVPETLAETLKREEEERLLQQEIEKKEPEVRRKMQEYSKGKASEAINEILVREMGKAPIETNIRRVLDDKDNYVTKVHLTDYLAESLNIPNTEVESYLRKLYNLPDAPQAYMADLYPSQNEEDIGNEPGDFVRRDKAAKELYEYRETRRHVKEITDLILDAISSSSDNNVLIEVPTYDKDIATQALYKVPESLKKGRNIQLTLSESPTTEVNITQVPKARIRTTPIGPGRVSGPVEEEKPVSEPPEFPFEYLYETALKTKRRPIMIYVHPQDYDTVRSQADRLGILGTDTKVLLAVDNSLNPFDEYDRFVVKILPESTSSYLPYATLGKDIRADEEETSIQNGLSAIERQTRPAYLNAITDQSLGSISLAPLIKSQGYRRTYSMVPELKEELAAKGINVSDLAIMRRLDDELSMITDEDKTFMVTTKPTATTAEVFSTIEELASPELQKDYNTGMEEASKYYRDLTPSPEQIKRYWFSSIQPIRSDSYAAGWARMMQLFNIPLRMDTRPEQPAIDTTPAIPSESQTSYRGRVNGISDAISYIQRFPAGSEPDAKTVSSYIQTAMSAAKVDEFSQYTRGFIEGLDQLGYQVEDLEIPTRPVIRLPKLTLPVVEGVPASFIERFVKKYPDISSPDAIRDAYHMLPRKAPKSII